MSVSEVLRGHVLLALTVAAVGSISCLPDRKFAGLDMGPRRASFQERLVVRDLSNGLRVILVPDARTNLVSAVLHGRYPAQIDELRTKPKDTKKKEPANKEPPPSLAVVLSRLFGTGGSSPTLFATKQLEQYRRSAYRPEVSTLIVAGKFDLARMRHEIDLLFGEWHGQGTMPEVSADVRTPAAPGFVIVPADDDITVEIAIGFAPAVTNDRDRVAQFAALRIAKALTDGGCPLLTQRALASYLDDGGFARHVRRAARVYRTRRSTLSAALAQHSDRFEEVHATSGLHIGVFLRSGFRIDVRRLAAAGIAVSRLEPYYLTAPRRGLAIGFGRIHAEAIPQGVRRLAAACR